ncbi:ATP-dependent DNA helicase PIF1, partial [Trifolium pratense]
RFFVLIGLDDDASLPNTIHDPQVICETNAEQLPSNLDDDASLPNTIHDPQVICETNAEQFDIPSNPVAQIYMDSNNDTSQMICSSNAEQFDVPFDDDDDDLFGSSNDFGQIPAVSADYFNIGQPNCICKDCGAIMWFEERVKRSSRRNMKFSLCCSQGVIEIAPYKPLPEPLR